MVRPSKATWGDPAASATNQASTAQNAENAHDQEGNPKHEQTELPGSRMQEAVVLVGIGKPTDCFRSSPRSSSACIPNDLGQFLISCRLETPQCQRDSATACRSSSSSSSGKNGSRPRKRKTIHGTTAHQIVHLDKTGFAPTNTEFIHFWQFIDEICVEVQ